MAQEQAPDLLTSHTDLFNLTLGSKNRGEAQLILSTLYSAKGLTHMVRMKRASLQLSAENWEKVLDDSLYRFRIGLFAINGVNDFDAAEAADFFIQAFLGLNIVASCCEDQEGRNQMAELEAVTPAPMMRKARQIVKNLEQLELDLSTSNFDDCPW